MGVYRRCTDSALFSRSRTPRRFSRIADFQRFRWEFCCENPEFRQTPTPHTGELTRITEICHFSHTDHESSACPASLPPPTPRHSLALVDGRKFARTTAGKQKTGAETPVLFVRAEGVEPSRAFAHCHLKTARLPFRHARRQIDKIP